MAGNNPRKYLNSLLSTSIPFIWPQLQNDEYEIVGIFDDTEYMMRTKDIPHQYFRLYPSKEFISFMNKTNVNGTSYRTWLLDRDDAVLNVMYRAPSSFKIDNSDQLSLDESNINIKKNFSDIKCDIQQKHIEEAEKRLRVLCEELKNYWDTIISPEAKKILTEMGYDDPGRRSVFDSGRTRESKFPILQFF